MQDFTLAAITSVKKYTLMLDLIACIIGIKHDFPFINIRKVPREVLKNEGVTFARSQGKC